jgi:hypothetical protein
MNITRVTEDIVIRREEKREQAKKEPGSSWRGRSGRRVKFPGKRKPCSHVRV